MHTSSYVYFQIKGLKPVVVDCSSTGVGQILTNPINLKIVNGQAQNLKVYFSVPVSKLEDLTQALYLM